MSKVFRIIVRTKSIWALRRDKAFGKYLWLTNTVTSGILMAAGDLVQQEIEYHKNNLHADGYDWRRNKHMLYVGIVQGPLTHVFYKLLDKKLPGVAMKTVMKKIFLDQTIASPFCIVLFFLGMNYLDGEDMKASREELKNKFLTVYTADCMVWIPCQFLNFHWISSKYRVLYINVVTMCYNVFLSFIKHFDRVA